MPISTRIAQTHFRTGTMCRILELANDIFIPPAGVSLCRLAIAATTDLQPQGHELQRHVTTEGFRLGESATRGAANPLVLANPRQVMPQLFQEIQRGHVALTDRGLNLVAFVSL